MTPILLVGIPPTKLLADLLYAAFTKMGGFVHHENNINWFYHGLAFQFLLR
jgi:hypothetical protein